MGKVDMDNMYLPPSLWGWLWLTLAAVSLFFGPAGLFMAFVFFVCFGGTVKENPAYVRKKPNKKKWNEPKGPRTGIAGRRAFTPVPIDTSWPRDDQPAVTPEPAVTAEPVAEVKTLAITNHARRNLALRHGIITELTHLDYEELTPFEEEGEGCFIALFSEINKSKEFAVFLDEDKKVIKTFMPHTDYNRNRAYFKKHINLDNALKDDMTKDLDFLQKVWLDKLA